MIDPSSEWVARSLASHATEMAGEERVSVVDAAYFNGIADILNHVLGCSKEALVYPEKLARMLDRYYDSI